ncbi:MAG TPA: hypothetical protein VIH90_03365, partial [Candidatus Saccharimonadales bacterium]
KFVFLGNQLVNSNNNIQAVLATGLVSDPNGLTNTVLYWWNGASYTILTYYKDIDAQNQFAPTFGDGWYTGTGAFATNQLNQGKQGGHFVKNPSTSPITVTMVGQVLQGTNVYSITPGFNTYTIAEPVSTNLNSALVNFPGTSDPNGLTNDIYYHFNGNSYDILTYYTDTDAQNQFAPTFGNGWYTAAGAFGSTNASLWPKVGEGFWIRHAAASTVNWTNAFTVQ